MPPIFFATQAKQVWNLFFNRPSIHLPRSKTRKWSEPATEKEASLYSHCVKAEQLDSL